MGNSLRPAKGAEKDWNRQTLATAIRASLREDGFVFSEEADANEEGAEKGKESEVGGVVFKWHKKGR